MGGGARTAWQGDGGSSAGFERYGGSRQCTLPDGEALPAWARSRGGSKAAPRGRLSTLLKRSSNQFSISDTVTKIDTLALKG